MVPHLVQGWVNALLLGLQHTPQRCNLLLVLLGPLNNARGDVLAAVFRDCQMFADMALLPFEGAPLVVVELLLALERFVASNTEKGHLFKVVVFLLLLLHADMLITRLCSTLVCAPSHLTPLAAVRLLARGDPVGLLVVSSGSHASLCVGAS